MLSLQTLFGKSPFNTLIKHIESVRSCIVLLPKLIQAFKENRFSEIEAITATISEKEHLADEIKNDIRNSLSGSLFLSVDKLAFISILELQDNIADAIEDIAVLMTLRPLTFLDIEPYFSKFVATNVDSFNRVYDMVQELPELNEVSFTGIEAEKVKLMANAVAKKEHEADIIQRELIKGLFKNEKNLTIGMFHQWQKILEAIGSISDVSEKLALGIRGTIDTSGT